MARKKQFDLSSELITTWHPSCTFRDMPGIQSNLFTCLLTCILVLCSQIAISQQQEKYSKVDVKINQLEDVQHLYDLGLEVDHYSGNINSSIQFFVKQSDIPKLEMSGLRYEVLIEDFQAFYEKRQLKDQAKILSIRKKQQTASNFGYGSMGGFYTFAEIEMMLDSMKTLFPNLITAKTSIGNSIEGRPIWSVKISDNPDFDESEPVAYYDALHHAREPLSGASLINFMFWLLENYGTNPEVSYIINERELYFVPVVNPDGYVYNQTTNPNGGGFWRKNRRTHTNQNCPGVDLNRNYSYLWDTGASSNCSSTNICSQVYRGSTSFSEPESQAVRDLVLDINPATASSIHSTAGNLILPDATFPDVVDFDLYSDWCTEMLDGNEYPFGTVQEMLGYSACGVTIDFLHNLGTYSWSPEVDGSGFWPAQSEIFELVDGMVYPLFYQAWIAGAFARIQSVDQKSDAFPGGSFDIEVTMRNKGLNQIASNVEVQIICHDPNIQISPPVAYANIPAQSFANNASSPFIITVPSNYSTDDIDLEIISTQAGAETSRENYRVCLGQRQFLFSDDAENTSTNWTHSGTGVSWSICTDDFYTGSRCYCDSNGGNTSNNSNNSFTLNQTFDLSPTTSPKLCFFAKWSIEDFVDNITLEISTNGGVSWISLQTFTNNQHWTQHCYDLIPYANSSQVKFRFVLETNNFLVSDGFYFDDFTLFDIGESCADGIQNASETGIDCGGINCPPCPCDGDVYIVEQLSADVSGKYRIAAISNTLGSEITNDASVSLSAGNYIQLNPNFEILQGSVVHLLIEDCQ